MSLSFSGSSLHIPVGLIDAMLAGDVVFLCGTGISAPQLPNFQQLVDLVSEHLGEPLTSSERLAYDEKRFEEVLGSIARRMADRSAMVRAAAHALQVPEPAALGQHKIVLRLSRDVANRVLIVTTNFDTLLERAEADVLGDTAGAAVSIAGQALPAPGSSDFSGIIHLHGRLLDELLSLTATPLVLTSADYGDAYMRGGWASRFLFDLARCKTIVLLGYSAGDAPVRYFLNVLEADRERFPDLKQVYAFAPHKGDVDEAERPWGTVAVTPIPYCEINPETQAHDHSALWQGLEEVASFIERPKATREARLAAILSQPSSSLTDSILQELRWLISGGANPWKVVITVVRDARWFDVLQTNLLLPLPDAQWVLAAWISFGWQEPRRFLVAVKWYPRLGPQFLEGVGARLRSAPGLSPQWKRAWTQLVYAQAEPSDAPSHAFFMIQCRLASGTVLDQDIVRAISLITPGLELRVPFGMSSETPDDGHEQGQDMPANWRLRDLVRVDFSPIKDYEGNEIIRALAGLPEHANRILQAASSALVSAVETAVDAELIDGDIDLTDYSVPSVESHRQNAHHGGVVPLILVIATAFSQLAATDREAARRAVAPWFSLPGRIGKRLTLHAMRNPAAFTGNEAFESLLALSDVDFWSIKREVLKLLGDRAADADLELRSLVEQRILQTGEAYYRRFDIDANQLDWRNRAKDNDVWLRLEVLERADALGDASVAELAALKVRYPHLARELEDRDYFSTFTSEVRRVEGDTASITSATPGDRLEVARELTLSDDIEKRQGWAAYCRADPEGAFAVLHGAPLIEANIELWNAFLSALSFGDEAAKERRNALAVRSTASLATLTAQQLTPITGSIIDLFYFGPRTEIADREAWYDRLSEALRLDVNEVGDTSDLLTTAINHPVGRLVTTLLKEIEAAIEADGVPLAGQADRLSALTQGPGKVGYFARAVLVQHIAFLRRACDQIVIEVLVPALNSDEEGRELRAILIGYSAITPEVTRLLGPAVLMAAREARVSGENAQQIAAVLLRPALRQLRQDLEPEWGLTMEEIRDTLREVPAAVRRASLAVLVGWLHAEPGGVEQAWASMAGPFIEVVWPKGRHFLDVSNNIHFAELAVGAGASFPAALEAVRHYIVASTPRRISLHAIQSSSAVRNFPRQTLDLLWILHGPMGEVGYEMPELLQALIEADPELEVDRRLQSLDQRAIRF